MTHFYGFSPQKDLKTNLKWEKFLDKKLNSGFFTSLLGAILSIAAQTCNRLKFPGDLSLRRFGKSRRGKNCGITHGFDIGEVLGRKITGSCLVSKKVD